MTLTALPTPLLPRHTLVEVNGETIDAVEHINKLIFDATIPESRHLSIKLPDHSPTGVRVLIRVKPNEPTPTPQATPTPLAQDLIDLFDMLDKLPPTGRTKEEIDQQVRAERDSWGP